MPLVSDNYLLMFYVCEYSDGRPLQFLAGPYETEELAAAASGAFEAERPEYRTKTFVWTCKAGREYFSRRIDQADDGSPGESAVALPVQSPAPHHPTPSQLALLSSYFPGPSR
jgi:hypothetical protein